MTSSQRDQIAERSSLARDTVGTTLTNAALFLLGIISWALIARLLGPVWRGELALVMLAPALVIKMGAFGYDYGMIVMGGKQRSVLGPLTSTGAVLGLILSILYMAIFLGFMLGFPKVFWKLSQVWLPLDFIVITMAFPLHMMTMAFDSAIYAEDRIAARNVKELVINIVMIAIIIVAFFKFKLELTAVVGAYVIANIVSLGYALILVRRRIDLSRFTEWKLAKEAVRMGFPVYVAQLASYLMLPAMMLVLSFSLSGDKFDNLARIAYFTMAYQMIDRILPVTRSVSFALLPKITTASDKDASDLAAKASRQTLLVSIVLFFVLAMLMQPIVEILLGARFIPVVWAFVFLAPAGVALSVGGVWSNHLLARTRPYEVARAGIIGVVVALIVSGIGFQFTSSREVLVAAGAVLIGSFVNAGFLLSSFCRVGKISINSALIPTMSDFREWKRIPGLIREMVNRKAGVNLR